MINGTEKSLILLKFLNAVKRILETISHISPLLTQSEFTCGRGGLLHIKVRLPVLLCAVKTVEGDFRFCWTITPNVGQTHKENPNLVRILYMVCTLNDIYKQYNKLHEYWYTKISSLRCIEDRNASDLVYEILVICRALQALYTPQRCELMKTKTNNTNCSYRIFIVCRSPVSPVFWARMLLSYLFLSLPKQSLCTDFAITR